MSLDATRWAWMQQGIGATRKLVLLSLADRADENNVAFPSIARLEQDTDLDRKTIMRSLAGLEQLGLVESQKAQGAVTRYRLIGVSDRCKPVPKLVPVPKTVPVPKLGLGSTKIGTGTSTKIGTQNLPIESINNLKTNTARETTRRSSSMRSDFELHADWYAWAIEYDRTIDATAAFEEFRDYWVGNGKPMRDWFATWRNWIRRHKRYAASRSTSGATQRAKDRAAERDEFIHDFIYGT